MGLWKTTLEANSRAIAQVIIKYEYRYRFRSGVTITQIRYMTHALHQR